MNTERMVTMLRVSRMKSGSFRDGGVSWAGMVGGRGLVGFAGRAVGELGEK